MINFRILYLTVGAGEKFRERSPRKPPFVLRRSHYENGPELPAEGPYELWRKLREQSGGGVPDAPRPIEVGDALESADGVLLCNFWGFDAAQWTDAEHSGGQREVAENGAP